MFREKIASCCRELKLGSDMALLSQNTKAESHQEYLYKILDDEIKRRAAARKIRYLNNAGFYTVKTFKNYLFDEVKLPMLLSPDSLKECSFLENKENLILYGNVGTGKTHLATAIGVEACKKGKEVKFFRTAALVNLLVEHKANGELTKFLKKLNRADLLILDEWGYIPLDREGAQLLFQVVSDCYEKRSLIITTNLEFSKWVTIFYDEQMTSAIIDRIVHHGHLLLFDGASRRLQFSSMKMS